MHKIVTARGCSRNSSLNFFLTYLPTIFSKQTTPRRRVVCEDSLTTTARLQEFTGEKAQKQRRVLKERQRLGVRPWRHV